MFLGEHQRSLDAKGRVILPARFRELMEGGAVMAKALGGCLSVYPLAEFEAVAGRWREISKRGAREREAARSFFAGAAEVAPDRQGRVPIPQNLREFAGLTREVTLCGAFDRIEIWDAQRFRERNVQSDASIVDATPDLSEFT